MHLFDTHFHLKEFEKELSPQLCRQAMLDSCARTGFAPESFGLNAVGGNFEESLQAREFAHGVPDCVFSAGVHPGNAGDFSGDVSPFGIFAGDPLLAAVGELGLDYYYDADTAPQQRRTFGAFLELALKWDKPAVVHLRDKGDDAAFRDGLALLADFVRDGGRFEVHCFTGSREWGEKILELGGYIGVTGMVTFRRAENVREILRALPEDRILLETDSPYLAPVPYRGRENNPGFLGLIAVGAAAVRGVTVDELADLTAANARRFFRLELSGPQTNSEQ